MPGSSPDVPVRCKSEKAAVDQGREDGRRCLDIDADQASGLLGGQTKPGHLAKLSRQAHGRHRAGLMEFGGADSRHIEFGHARFMLMSNVSTDQLSATAVDQNLVDRLYARFASVYNGIFGPILHAGRVEAMRELPLKPDDEILEVGIGTGLTATLYPSNCRVMGIDLSEPMLREAARHVESHGRGNVRLWQMDASSLGFPDESFDVVYAAYVVSVVPDPVGVLREMRRVCRPGGRIVLLNHFLSANPILSALERWISPLTVRAGFRSDLDLSVLLAQAGLEPVSVKKVNTPRIWSLVHCRR